MSVEVLLLYQLRMLDKGWLVNITYYVMTTTTTTKPKCEYVYIVRLYVCIRTVLASHPIVFLQTCCACLGILWTLRKYIVYFNFGENSTFHLGWKHFFNLL